MDQHLLTVKHGSVKNPGYIAQSIQHAVYHFSFAISTVASSPSNAKHYVRWSAIRAVTSSLSSSTSSSSSSSSSSTWSTSTTLSSSSSKPKVFDALLPALAPQDMCGLPKGRCRRSCDRTDQSGVANDSDHSQSSICKLNVFVNSCQLCVMV